MIRKLKIIATILTLIPLISIGQKQSNIDSLLLELEENDIDTTEVIILNDLVWEYRNKDIDKAFEYVNLAYFKAVKCRFNNGIGLSLVNKAILHYFRSNYDSALVYCQKADEFLIKAKNYKELGRKNNIEGIVNNERGNYTNAEKHYLTALSYFKKINDKKQASTIYNNLGNNELSQNKYERAIEYYKQGIEFIVIDNNNRASLYRNMAKVYLYYNEDYKKALEYLKIAEKICIEIDDVRQLAYTKLSICDAYNGLQDYEKAIKYAKSALDLFRKISSKNYIAKSFITLVELNLKIKNYDTVNKYIDSSYFYLDKKRIKAIIALEIYRTKYYIGIEKYSEAQSTVENILPRINKTNLVKDKIEVFSLLSTISEKQNKIAQALNYNKLYNNLKDSLFNTEKHKQIAELQTKYETLEKEKKIQALALSNAQKEETISQLMLSSIIILVVLVTFFIIYRTQVKRKERELIVKIQEQEKRRNYEFFHNTGNKLMSISVDKKEISGQEIHRLGESMRGYSHLLYLPDFNKVNIEEAINELIAEYESLLKAEIIFNNNLPDKIFKKIKKPKLHVLYRIIQELFQNAIKHSDASEIKLGFNMNKKHIEVIYQDNGKGAESTKISAGKGIMYINQCIDMFKGSIEISSNPEIGFICSFDIPV